MKKYVVVLNKESKKSQFHNELSGLSSLEFIPDRECKIEDISDTRCFYAELTEDEAKELEKDPRVKSVEVRKPTLVVPMGFLSGSDHILKKLPGYMARPLPSHLQDEESHTPILIDAEKKCVVERNKNEFQEETPPQEMSSQSFDQTAFIENLPSGDGVDVVIVDGIITGRVSSTGGTLFISDFFFDNNEIVHPEFLDSDGNSRINLINWNQYAGEEGEYPYEQLALDRSQFGNNSHGLHVAGIACGTNVGWAKESAIYNMTPYAGQLTNYSKNLVALKNWHLSKGNSRPTVTNHSYGRLYPLFDIRYVNQAQVEGVTYEAPRNDTGATATCSVENGKIVSITVTNPGSGYTNRPTVSFNGGGGDEAALIMGQGSVKKITVTNTGSGYDPQNPPSVTFSSPPQGDTATGHCEVDDQGRILRIVMTNRGEGYLSPPLITFSQPASGSVATAECEIGSNFIKRIQILNSVSNIPFESWGGCTFRGANSLSFADPPMLIISGGNCSKQALWTLTQEQQTLDQWYLNDGNLVDGMYNIAEKKVILSENSFSQTLLGGEYVTQPDVSFLYFNAAMAQIVGPMGIAEIESGSVASITPYWGQEGCFGGNPEAPGWFTSPPQIFITNGGGFTASQMESWGFRTISELSSIPPGFFPRIADNIPAIDTLENSIVEDMIESGVVVIGASGNSSYEIKNKNDPSSYNSITVNYCWFSKPNPSVPYEDNISGQEALEFWSRFSYYVYFFGGLFDLGDNVYDLSNKGSGPSSADGAICVGSLSHLCCPEKKSVFSNTGTRIDLYAAGDHITSCSYYGSSFIFAEWAGQVHAAHPSDSRYGLIKMSGTSMASPQVCGAVASALTQGYSHPPASSSPADITSWLKSNAVSSLTDLPFPNDLKGGTDKQLYFPGVNVIT